MKKSIPEEIWKNYTYLMYIPALLATEFLKSCSFNCLMGFISTLKIILMKNNKKGIKISFRGIYFGIDAVVVGLLIMKLLADSHERVY
ncbi:MAG: hypothetical protein ABIR50_03020 [Ginsengibacter sp.]